jgi:outer membrane protein TolC
VAAHSVGVLQKSLDITLRQRKLGALSEFEVETQKQLLEEARAEVPSFEAAHKSALYELAVLTGQPPTAISDAADHCTALPQLNVPIPVGDGAALVERRPDVRESERALAADTARIGIAMAELLPTVTLGGSFQGASTRVGSVFDQPTFSLGPLISWTFPNIVAARARLQASRADADRSLATFDGTLLTALKEVEQALTAYAGELHRRESLLASRDAAAAAFRIAQARYTKGSLSGLNLIVVERTLIDAEAALAASNGAVANDQIAVFKALGGGWQDAPKVETKRAG